MHMVKLWAQPGDPICNRRPTATESLALQAHSFRVISSASFTHKPLSESVAWGGRSACRAIFNPPAAVGTRTRLWERVVGGYGAKTGDRWA
jgi:hypothetical protein